MSKPKAATEAAKAANLKQLAAQAPDRCEMCNLSLPTFDKRLEHIEDTGHCACPDIDCWIYIPPGEVYNHFCAMHGHESWNDHQIASGDRSTLRRALPWVRQAFRERMNGLINVESWLGIKNIEDDAISDSEKEIYSKEMQKLLKKRKAYVKKIKKAEEKRRSRDVQVDENEDADNGDKNADASGIQNAETPKNE
jgi:hypothetical protein